MKLTIYTKELFYDIANCSYIEGDIMSGDNIQAKRHTQDIVAEGNVDRVYRVLDLVHAECVEMLYPFSKSSVTSVEMDDKQRSPETYEFHLNLPSDMSETTVNLLRTLLHEYMVCRVLADWFSMTNPQSVDNWGSKCELLKHKIRTSIGSRMTLKNRKLNPF